MNRHSESKWYAVLFVGWAGPWGRRSWTADVVEDHRRVGIEHRHCDPVCGDCPLDEGWTPLGEKTPSEATAAASAIRDALIAGRRRFEGEPCCNDVLTDELGDHEHLLALSMACMPVWAKAGRPPILRWRDIALGLVGLVIGIASAWYFLFHR